ncbi:hypothetical protein AALA94_05935 [Lactococcus taiwanensis]|nr:hypothetical protein P7266_1299 [Lactococcus cremoris]
MFFLLLNYQIAQQSVFTGFKSSDLKSVARLLTELSVTSSSNLLTQIA